MLVLSQHVEQLYARELLSDGSGGVGYLLKDRVSDVGQFVDAVRRVAAAAPPWTRRSSPSCWPAAPATAPGRADPARTRGARADGRGTLQRRDRPRLFVTEKAVSKHINNIFTKLDLHPSDDDNRRVLAVLTYLGG